ncbi:hypothetical protein GGS26DRAFT_602176 [Hypomontagnella submonticulosa]|nr:hypothetical protein GGS26DRAFT_602176 [Hypomontagnella submonticulosa]
MSTSTPSSDPSAALGQAARPSSRWSEIEDDILKQAVALHGVNQWDDVARMVWTRKSAEECRSRWAELVPILHDSLARREYHLEQEQKLRKRSMTASAATSDTSTTAFPYMPSSQRLEYILPSVRALGRPVPGTEYPFPNMSEAAGTAKSRTEPSSPTPASPLPAITIPIPIPEPLPSTPEAAARSRRNTEPSARSSPPPYRSTVRPQRGAEQQQPQSERIAPHPLMPGRPRKRSVVSAPARDDATTSESSRMGERGRGEVGRYI